MNKKRYNINNINKDTVHYILLHSYLIFLVAIILGVFFDTFLKEKIFSNNIYQNIGFIMLMFGSIIIYWAQKSSADYKNKAKEKNLRSKFEVGPYKYTRSPTHFGLFVMTLGFSLIINSVFSVVFVVIASIITKIFFIKKQEILLERKYGEVYSEYKKRIKNWI